MTKTKRSRKQISSIVAIVLCFCMLLGTTFAWFTDAVSSVENKITAGNLDVELYHVNSSLAGTEEKVGEKTDLFLDEKGEEILWEPGVATWENFIVKNEGTLALKYELAMRYKDKNVVVETDGRTTYKLSEALKVAVVKGGVNAASNRDAMLASISDKEWTPMKDFITAGNPLLAGKDETFGVVIYWEPGADDNNWNVNNGKTTSGTGNANDPLQIDLAIELEATQFTYESDSFDHLYDGDAKTKNEYVPVELDLEGSEMSEIELKADIVLDPEKTEINTPKTINLNGYNIVANRYVASGKTSPQISALTLTADVTILGSGKVTNVNEEWVGPSYTNCGAYAITIDKGANVTIKDGTYESDADAIYVIDGSLNIEGGFFAVVDDVNGKPDSHENGCDNGNDGCHASTVINVNKNCWNSIGSVAEATAIVEIKGGTFVNFDPSNVREDANWGSMHHTNFVADGYKVVSETQSNGDVWYTVVPE